MPPVPSLSSSVWRDWRPGWPGEGGGLGLAGGAAGEGGGEVPVGKTILYQTLDFL